MANRLLQANLNHASVAQDLIMQVAAERDAGLIVVAEPYRVPPRHPHWTTDPSATSAITWRQAAEPLPCTPKRAGTRFAVVKWGDIVVVGVYIPPGRGRIFFEERLDLIGGGGDSGTCPLTDYSGRGLQRPFSGVGFPANGSEGEDPGGMGGVVRATSIERRLHEHVCKAAGGVGGRSNLGHCFCCGQGKKMAGGRGAHGHGPPVH